MRVASKVMPLAEAVARFVEPHDTIALAFGDARPNAAVREIVRRFRGSSPRFTIVASGLVSTQQSLVGAGLVDTLITSFAGENYPSPYPSAVIRRAVEAGTLTVEDWSLYSLVARLAAGALNVPFFPVRSFASGSMRSPSGDARWAQVEDPFSGADVTVVPQLQPDVCLVHGVAADPDGNVVLAGPTGEREWGALAARRGVIATVERVVTREELRGYNHVVRVPGAVVAAVCEVEGGSHPYGLYSGGILQVEGYDEDADFILAVREAMRDPETFDRWVDSWLELDWPRVRQGGRTAVAPAPVSGGYTDSELMIVSAARMLSRRTEEGQAELILAGIGQANLAAWLAYEDLQDRHPVQLLAEMGIVGYEPQPGDSYLFANRNKPSASQLTDTMAVLGCYVGHHRVRTLAAVGAGQVDGRGNINSTVGVDGRYLTGSGGANDIASVAAELLVVIRQSEGRLPEELPFVTAPGQAVQTVVTDRAIFTRVASDSFALHRLLRPFDANDASIDELLRAVQQTCGWSRVEWPEDVECEPAPTEQELLRLRQFDPHRYFLR